jgi:hypothetical protein
MYSMNWISAGYGMKSILTIKVRTSLSLNTGLGPGLPGWAGQMAAVVLIPVVDQDTNSGQQVRNGYTGHGSVLLV